MDECSLFINDKIEQVDNKIANEMDTTKVQINKIETVLEEIKSKMDCQNKDTKDLIEQVDSRITNEMDTTKIQFNKIVTVLEGIKSKMEFQNSGLKKRKY